MKVLAKCKRKKYQSYKEKKKKLRRFEKRRIGTVRKRRVDERVMRRGGGNRGEGERKRWVGREGYDSVPQDGPQ